LTPIANITIRAVGADGETFPLDIAVGVPFVSERHGTWACPLTLHPLWSKPNEVAGEDSLQALCLALRVARSMLDSFCEDGGQLLFNDGTPFPLGTYFGTTL
jgi:hypothetical protein